VITKRCGLTGESVKHFHHLKMEDLRKGVIVCRSCGDFNEVYILLGVIQESKLFEADSKPSA
jgi:hypothetical protein